MPLVAGRDFDERDVASRRTVLIVNETFARHYFGAENPVGRFVGLDRGVFDVEIIGVVKDSKADRPSRRASPDGVRAVSSGALGIEFHPSLADDREFAGNRAIAAREDERDRSHRRRCSTSAPLRTRSDGRCSANACWRRSPRSLESWRSRLRRSGLYGVLSYGVMRRTRELGIRVAIGATARNILWLVLREAGWMLCIGIAIGLGGAWALGKGCR